MNDLTIDNPLMPYMPKDPLMDCMVDDATGVPVAFLIAFAKWHNENIWGEEEGHPVDARSEYSDV